jgi:ring-1,2-phenylacetyl-CoA epoxidase subunit PaaD
MIAKTSPSVEDIWSWLAQVEDPEIPVLSILDLGIVREVRWGVEKGVTECVVTITPTYSGCPATEVIAQSIRDHLHAHGVDRVRLETQISPAWTTDWLTDEGRRKLHEYGIAPPTEQAIPVSAIGRGPRPASKPVVCPRCLSDRTEQVSQFGSTPCKALYRCLHCLEPFDFFKCH